MIEPDRPRIQSRGLSGSKNPIAAERAGNSPRSNTHELVSDTLAPVAGQFGRGVSLSFSAAIRPARSSWRLGLCGGWFSVVKIKNGAIMTISIRNRVRIDCNYVQTSRLFVFCGIAIVVIDLILKLVFDPT